MENKMDFYFPSTQIDLGGPVTKCSNNIEAIRILKECEAAKRVATFEEQQRMARYVGWGDSRVLTQANYHKNYKEIRALVSDDELRSIYASSLNAHYTALPVIESIWRALLASGLENIPAPQILDPSAGIGHFKSCQPESLRKKAHWTEVELDKLTAGILSLLHPNSDVQQCGYEEAQLPEELFDLAISNVPFGDYGVFSKDLPRYLTNSIHDFFFANTVRYLRPGGVMAFITSRYTMDKKVSRIRKYLAQHLTLEAAVRLPNNAFKANAGTEVVTDILIFKKKAEPEEEEPDWINTSIISLERYSNTLKFAINKFYIDNPDKILGKQTATGSMYRSDGYDVEPECDDISELIFQALQKQLPENLFDKVVAAEKEQQQASVEIITTQKTLSEKDQKKFDALREIYTVAKQLLRAEIENTSLFDTSALRDKLNKLYDQFVLYNGLINSKPNLRLLEGTSEGSFLKALEIEQNGVYKKAAIFRGPVVRSEKKAENATVEEALLISLDRKGKVDLDFIAEIANVDRDTALGQLLDLLYMDPVTHKWIMADEYLSGNVRLKLKQAKAIAKINPDFQRNVDALEKVLPKQLEPGEIRAVMGAGWIPADLVAEWICELLKTWDVTVQYIPDIAQWVIDCPHKNYIADGLMNSRWGTRRVSALELIDKGLNSKTPEVKDKVGDVYVINASETAAAQAKLEEIKNDFEQWMWRNPERADRLVEIYNDLFNTYVPRTYDGRHLSTPGLSLDIDPYPHQKDGAWRILQNKTTVIPYNVGSGKTLTATMAVMEGKRLGLFKKSMIVVPNNLSSQWYKEILLAYPNVNILAVETKDLSKENRGTFLSKIATHDWDVIVIPISTFKLLPTHPKTNEDYFQEELDKLRDYLEMLQTQKITSDSNIEKKAIKEIEKAIKRLEVKLRKNADMRKDSIDTITFEELGIDMLIVDEAHLFKNLGFHTKHSRIAGLPNTNSERATDLMIKSQWLIRHNGKFVLMTGTPVSNTIAELYTMQRYTQADLLENLGLTHFDAWANQFAIAEPALELTPEGTGFHLVTRFRKYVNMPELMRLWYQVADVRELNNNRIEKPKLYSGKPVVMLSDGGKRLEEYMAYLSQRAERVRQGMVEPTEDNMLLITTDGRKAALDTSLVIEAEPGARMPKIDGLARLAAEIYKISEPTRGTQLIFCDLATPKTKKGDEEPAPVYDDLALNEAEILQNTETTEEARLTLDVYNEIKRRLIARGVPENEIVFIHDAKKPADRAKLFEKVNNGDVRILIGSTEKMGVGMNVQKRLLALHQITTPWRPADSEQQVGRIIRPGNLYPQVYQIIHITKRSCDSFMWQTNETKLGFIEQINNGTLQAREVDDLSDNVMTAAQVKALASDDPKIFQKATLDSEIQRLEAVRRSWEGTQSQNRWLKVTIENRLAARKKAADQLKEAIEIRNKNTSEKEKFGIHLRKSVDDETEIFFDDREQAGKHMRKLSGFLAEVYGDGVVIPLGHYKGLPLVVKPEKVNNPPEIVPYILIKIADDYLLNVNVAESDAGATQSLTLRVKSLDEYLKTTQKDISIDEEKIKSLDEELEKGWEHQERYEKLKAEVEVLNKELDIKNKPQNPEEQDRPREHINDDSVKEIENMLADMRRMHTDPAVLARFKKPAVIEEQPIRVDKEAMSQIQKEIESKQALLEFGKVIMQAIPAKQPVSTKQNSLFDSDSNSPNELVFAPNVSVSGWEAWAAEKGLDTNKKKRKKTVNVPKGQQSFF